MSRITKKQKDRGKYTLEKEMKKKKHLYIMHTLDQYELPLIVTDDIGELARASGSTIGSIRSLMSKERHGVIKRCRYKQVDL